MAVWPKRRVWPAHQRDRQQTTDRPQAVLRSRRGTAIARRGLTDRPPGRSSHATESARRRSLNQLTTKSYARFSSVNPLNKQTPSRSNRDAWLHHNRNRWSGGGLFPRVQILGQENLADDGLRLVGTTNQLSPGIYSGVMDASRSNRPSATLVLRAAPSRGRNRPRLSSCLGFISVSAMHRPVVLLFARPNPSGPPFPGINPLSLPTTF